MGRAPMGAALRARRVICHAKAHPQLELKDHKVPRGQAAYCVLITADVLEMPALPGPMFYACVLDSPSAPCLLISTQN